MREIGTKNMSRIVQISIKETKNYYDKRICSIKRTIIDCIYATLQKRTGYDEVYLFRVPRYLLDLCSR